MAELPMRTIAFVIIAVVIAAVVLIYIFSGFSGADTSGTFFDMSKKITTDAAGAGAKDSALSALG